jgi:hypothetical protein
MMDHDLDTVCAVCGRPFRYHGAPVPRCSGGATTFVPSPASQPRRRGPTDWELARDASLVGVLARWRPIKGSHPETGDPAIIGWELANRRQVEDGAREYRRRGRSADPLTVSLAAIGGVE